MRLATTVAIAIVAYTMSSILHEFVGHSLVARILGAHVTSISSVNMNYDVAVVHAGLRKVISACGALANILTALVALAILRKRPTSANVRYFLWLFMTVSLLLATGYPGFSAVMGSGDWANVIYGLPHLIMWRALLLVISAVLYWISLRISAQELVLLIGSRSREVSRRLVLPAYFAGGLLFSIAAAFNPSGPRMLIWAAAASFGSMSGIVFSLSRFDSNEKPALPINGSIPWVLLAVVITGLFVSILGPGTNL